MLLSTGGVPGGDPPPLPHGRRGFELNFLIPVFSQAQSFSCSIISVAGWCRVAGVAAEELIESSLLAFSVEE